MCVSLPHQIPPSIFFNDRTALVTCQQMSDLIDIKKKSVMHLIYLVVLSDLNDN